MASRFRWPWRRTEAPVQTQPVTDDNASALEAARNKSESSVSIYENTSFTMRGEPTGYDFASIMREPQKCINDLYLLANYYKETDPYVGAAINNVYTPFSVAKGFKLTGASEKTKQRYLEHYENIGFEEKMRSIFDQYYTFQNVFIYLMPDGNIITLTPTRCRISEVYMNGEPVIEYDTQHILQGNRSDTGAKEEYLDDLAARLNGLPPEIRANFVNPDGTAAKETKRWVQLNPDNTFVMQFPKPDWARYAVPTIGKCLFALGRKQTITDYDNAQMRFGIKGFLQVKVGDKDPVAGMNKPDSRNISAVHASYEAALQGGKLVTVPWYVDSEFITVDTSTLFDHDKYSGVNQEILSAFGISGVVSLGQQEAGSYGQAKLSLDTAALRIEQGQRAFAAMMKKINSRLAMRLPRISAKNIPVFEFEPIDLTNNNRFADEVYKLWMQGLTSTQTLLEAHKLDIVQERERRISEKNEGIDNVFIPRQNAYTSNTTGNGGGGEDKGGRPTLDDSERTSDPDKSETGRQPKPSRPEGSEASA